MAARGVALAFAAALTGAPMAWAAEEPGFEWMSGAGDGTSYLVYGSPETGEDFVFNVVCSGDDKTTHMTVYVDIAGTKVGAPATIDLGSSSGRLSIAGKIATDEMSGFHFAEAEGFKVKPVIALLSGKGTIKVKTGNVVTTLPEEGRGKNTAEFAKSCSLD